MRPGTVGTLVMFSQLSRLICVCSSSNNPCNKSLTSMCHLFPDSDLCLGCCDWDDANSVCTGLNAALLPTVDGCCNCVDHVSLDVSENCSLCIDTVWANSSTLNAPSVHVYWQAPLNITGSVDGANMLMYVPVDVLKDAQNTFYMTAGFAQGAKSATVYVHFQRYKNRSKRKEKNLI